jgi:cytochrome c peroxidase
MKLRAGPRWAAAAVLACAAHAILAGDPQRGLPPLKAPPAAQVALGKALFFERRLSVNATLSCAMCHLPEQGFTSNELRTSVGMEGVSLRRNAPTLLNVAHARSLFHDGRVATLEAQALMPMLHPDEMANPSAGAVVARVAGWPEYRPLFRRAYGSARPTAARMARALAAYQRTLLAAGSRFDHWRFGGEASALDAIEQRGFALFQSLGCVACHPVGERHALFTDHGFHNVGVQARSEAQRLDNLQVQLIPGVLATLTPEETARIGLRDAPDLGRQEVTRRAADARAFRTPSLRNVALTAPYMHDGSLATLEAVVDHYIAGGWPADPAQDARLRPLAIDAQARDALVAFLRSLTSQGLGK